MYEETYLLFKIFQNNNVPQDLRKYIFSLVDKFRYIVHYTHIASGEKDFFELYPTYSAVTNRIFCNEKGSLNKIMENGGHNKYLFRPDDYDYEEVYFAVFAHEFHQEIYYAGVRQFIPEDEQEYYSKKTKAKDYVSETIIFDNLDNYKSYVDFWTDEKRPYCYMECDVDKTTAMSRFSFDEERIYYCILEQHVQSH